MEQIGEIWTSLLDLTSQVIMPVWNDLIQYIPLLIVLGLGAVVALLAWMWQRNARRNRPRVAPRLPPGRMPEGTHLPGPSVWPFVAPLGLGMMLFALVMGLDSLLDLGLLLLGVLVVLVASVGWIADAGREYRVVEAGGHGAEAGLLVGAGTPPAEREMPEGIHLPGPSAWPFLAPIGLVVALAGLVFGPALIVGGLVMGVIASIGWLIDAGREYRGVEEHGHAEPATRDPEQAFPKALGPVYVGVGAVAVAITLLPLLFSLLPGAGGGGQAAGPQPTEAPYISASSATGFDVTEIAVFAGRPFTLTFENKQAGVPHNVAIYDSPALATNYYLGEIFPGPATRKYEVDALAAGTYWYVCNVHPPMTGTLYAK